MFSQNLFTVAQGSQGGHTDKLGIRIQSTKLEDQYHRIQTSGSRNQITASLGL
jgi:hypothetical protein